MPIEKLIETFKKSNFDDKISSLTTIVEWLLSIDPVFNELLDTLNNNPNVNDEFLDWCYADIMTLADKAENIIKDKNIKNMTSSLHEKMQKLVEQERL